MEMATRESKARLILELGIQRKSILELTKKKKNCRIRKTRRTAYAIRA